MKPETIWKIAIVTAVAAAVTANIEPDQSTDVDAGRGKKEEKLIQEMIQAMMLAKNMVSFALMFVSPIIQIKGFGLSVINTLINIGRFLVQLQATKEMKQMHMSHLKVHYAHAHQTHDSEDLWSSGSDNRYAYYAPPPNTGVAQQTAYSQYSPNTSRMR